MISLITLLPNCILNFLLLVSVLEAIKRGCMHSAYNDLYHFNPAISNCYKIPLISAAVTPIARLIVTPLAFFSTQTINARQMSKEVVFSQVITPTYGHLWGTKDRPLGREARLFVKRGVFKQVLTVKMIGTGQNRSFKRGVRLTRVFVRRGSTVYIYWV